MERKKKRNAGYNERKGVGSGVNFHYLGNFTAFAVHWSMYLMGVNVFVLYVHSMCVTLECFYVIKLVPVL